MGNPEKTPAPPTESELAFIHEFSALLAPWGLAPSAGRVFGFLILNQVPVSVDDIARGLGMSRVGAWNSAKSLETFGHVRSYSVSGSKKMLYAPSDDFSHALRQQATTIGALGALLQNFASSNAAAPASPALENRAHFYTSMSESMESTIAALNATRSARSA